MDARSGAILAELVRAHRRAIVATIARRTGSLDVAEESVDRAIEAALEQWPVEGAPASPRAWLYRTAIHKATDALRHRAMAERVHGELALDSTDTADVADGTFPDDQLRLLFTCCHPAIADDAQVALALRMLSGLRTDEVARAFGVSEATMAQRLVRAKAKIEAAHIPYEVPEASELGPRVEAVLAVVYAIFNEGYVATGGPDLLRVDLATEALRLAELVALLLPTRREPRALLALLLLIDARRGARVDREGALVLLEDQDRALWDRATIARGKALLAEVLAEAPGERVPVHAIEAAIQALHDEAPTWAETDFRQIVVLYRLLRQRADSPHVELAEAAAIAMAEGAEAGLHRVRAMIARGTLSEHHLAWATEADLLRRLGRTSEALRAYERARSLATNEVERAYLASRIAKLRD